MLQHWQDTFFQRQSKFKKYTLENPTWQLIYETNISGDLQKIAKFIIRQLLLSSHILSIRFIQINTQLFYHICVKIAQKQQ